MTTLYIVLPHHRPQHGLHLAAGPSPVPVPLCPGQTWEVQLPVLPLYVGPAGLLDSAHGLDGESFEGGVCGEAGLEVGGLGGVDGEHSSQLNSRMLWG